MRSTLRCRDVGAEAGRCEVGTWDSSAGTSAVDSASAPSRAVAGGSDSLVVGVPGEVHWHLIRLDAPYCDPPPRLSIAVAELHLERAATG